MENKITRDDRLSGEELQGMIDEVNDAAKQQANKCFRMKPETLLIIYPSAKVIRITLDEIPRIGESLVYQNIEYKVHRIVHDIDLKAIRVVFLCSFFIYLYLT